MTDVHCSSVMACHYHFAKCAIARKNAKHLTIILRFAAYTVLHQPGDHCRLLQRCIKANMSPSCADPRNGAVADQTCVCIYQKQVTHQIQYRAALTCNLHGHMLVDHLENIASFQQSGTVRNVTMLRPLNPGPKPHLTLKTF